MDELERLRSKFPRKDNASITKPIVPEPYHRYDISDTTTAPDDKHKIPKVNDGRIEADEMAAYVMSFLDFITVRETKENDVLVYSPTLGIYTPDGDKVIAMRSESFLLSMGLGSTVTNHYIKEITGHVVRQTFISKSELDANMDIIVCRNGVIKLSTGELLPFDKKYKATIAIPVTYDTNAVCPQIDKFISEVVEPADPLAHGLEIRQQATEPAVVDVGHAGRLGDLAHGVARLLLRADEQHGAAAVGDGARELARLVEQALGLQQVDDVDAVALSMQKAAHLGVPSARLVAKMDSGLQQLLDSGLGHGELLVMGSATARRAGRT